MVENRNNRYKTKKLIDWTAIISGIIVGAILGISSTLYFQGKKIAKLEEQIKSHPRKSVAIIQKSKINPEKLIKIIEDKQTFYVRESWGIEENECFTERDFNAFKNSKIPTKIVAELNNDNDFIDLILTIKKMAPSDWQNLKEKCLNSYKPTWKEIGKIDRKGQTEYGQLAEKMISKAIVNFVVELLNQSPEYIETLYKY